MVTWRLVFTCVLIIIEFILINSLNIVFPIDVLDIKTMVEMIVICIIALLIITFMISTLIQYIRIHNTKIEKLEERDAIISLIWFIDAKSSDTASLNTLIASYNQWVIKIIGDKKSKRWFSYYAPLDMQNHTIINFI